MSEDQKPVTEIAAEQSPVDRRTFIRRSLASVAMTATGMVAAYAEVAEAREKATKAMAKYRHYPNKGQVCAACVHYTFPFSCGAVSGLISPHGWCRFYKPKG